MSQTITEKAVPGQDGRAPQEARRPLVLLAATVDSGGGAGITADSITVFDTGAFPLPLALRWPLRA